MAPVSIDDLIASLKGNGIGQEASDLEAVKAHLSQTLGSNASQNGYTPTHTSNTPQGTPVATHPPMGVPWDTRGMSASARRHRSQSRGFDMAIDEAEEPAERTTPRVDTERWRSPQRKAMHSPQESFSGHGFPSLSPISSTAPPLSPPASPTRHIHHHPMPIPTNSSPYSHGPHPYAHAHAHGHGHDTGYAAAQDPFLQQMQQAQGGPTYYGQFFPQSPPMDACPPTMNPIPGWNPAGQWQSGYPQPVQAREDTRR
ncbi:hypothetical protein DACRYDRAFT_97914 [Dacryopinax primogenitus]|uniref:Uncharacterized protein n=1 Tax=Dacryopinax primogenitus (strain DJM 731) TaxID=1858805 RepID=M5GBV6_DACPD|nr:uncharacterized protein DACRYDRAFT_97914 [Dacryopinax primogenitus]EJU06479.1 hypothetical protein DACRYDRAFT_97914 [Dacryopinax primogenitus]